MRKQEHAEPLRTNAERLSVRFVNATGGRRWPLLCFPDGTPLPNQRHVKIDAPLDEVTTITIEFVVDGNMIRLEES